MRRLFLDTNVLLSFHFQDAKERQQKAIEMIFSGIEQKRWNGFIWEDVKKFIQKKVSDYLK